jgi:Ser/Thr protein kinase RdoA (MazF antagonist)
LLSAPVDSVPAAVLASFPIIQPGASAQPFGTGLINRTYLVEDGAARFVLQKVNPIFPVTIHENIEAVTAHLAQQGLMTPRLLPTSQGKSCLELGPAGVWRLWNHVDGVSFDVIRDTDQSQAAAALVGRFHRALDDFDHPFVGMRLGVHDTPKHLQRLRDGVSAQAHRGHRLHAAVSELAADILAAVARLPPLPVLPDRVCHGDLKFNNILFAGTSGAAAGQPMCLIDLDTLGPMPLAFELGDAWRSWCNRNGENNPVAALDLQVFRASLEGYRSGLGRPLSKGERQALLLGLDWVSVELAARFAADALYESYFGWDPKRFAGRGEHNLIRARSQFTLHQEVAASRPERARLLELDPT